MDADRQSQAAASHIAASEDERRQMDQGEPLYGFRPLGLPALTGAAARTRPTPPAPAAPRGPRRGILAIVHENEPLA